MDTIDDAAKRIRLEQRRAAIARNAARRAQDEKDAEARADKRFKETRDRFRDNVAYWNQTKQQPPLSQTLAVHRDTLHRRLLWTENDAVSWNRRDDGTYVFNAGAIDGLHKPMALLLQFVKAEHKIAHDRRTHVLRAQTAAARGAKAASPKRDEKNDETGERPHTPELSA